MKRQGVEALDNSLRDIMDHPNLSFGGKTMVFGGDFRQVLPVVQRGSRAQIVGASLRMSYLWNSIRHLKLVQYEGKERPMVCRILATHRGRL